MRRNEQISIQFLVLSCLLAMAMILHLPQVQAVPATSAKPVTQVQPVANNAKSVPQVPPQTQTAQTPKPPKVQDAKCLQPLEVGPCRMSLERYYYNKDKNACETFKFGGCRGNDNRFGFKQTCEEACLVKK